MHGCFSCMIIFVHEFLLYISILCRRTCTIMMSNAYTPSIQTWTKLTISGRKPPIRSVHATCGIPGPTKTHVLVAGGLGEGWKKLGDIWLLDVDKREWSEVSHIEQLDNFANCFSCLTFHALSPSCNECLKTKSCM